MMTAKNKTGVTRWERCKDGKESEPDSWRAFKVGPSFAYSFYNREYSLGGVFRIDESSCFVLHGYRRSSVTNFACC